MHITPRKKIHLPKGLIAINGNMVILAVGKHYRVVREVVTIRIYHRRGRRLKY
jgi:hypothetical protein